MAQLESNTQELREILNTVNALPTAGEGGGGAQQCDLEIYVYNPPIENGYSGGKENYQISITSGFVQDVINKIVANEKPRVFLRFVSYYMGIEMTSILPAVDLTFNYEMPEYGWEGGMTLTAAFQSKGYKRSFNFSTDNEFLSLDER